MSSLLEASELAARMRAMLPAPTPAQVEALKAAHPGLVLWCLSVPQGGIHLVVSRPVPPAALARYSQHLAGQHRGRALELLLRDCVLFPGAAALREAFWLKPGLVDSFGAELLGLADVPEADAPVQARCPTCKRRLVRCTRGPKGALRCDGHPTPLRFTPMPGGRLKPLGVAKQERATHKAGN